MRTVRRAQKVWEFANKHRKTQKVLVSGFATLDQAIQGLGHSIAESIEALRLEIELGLAEVSDAGAASTRSLETIRVEVEQIRRQLDS